MREIVLDTETTGLDPKTGHRVVEIGCVEIVNRFLTGKTFHAYINPERAMPPDAFAIHGLSDGFLKDKPKFAEIADAFVDFIAESTLVIHNASFDVMFLNFELGKLGKSLISNDRVVDTLMLARRKHPGQPNSLDALCARYGIDNSHRTKHGALLDSEILAEVYGELTGGRQQTLSLASASAPRAETANRQRRRERPNLPPLLTEAEKEAHARFVEGMGDKALWRSYLGLDGPKA